MSDKSVKQKWINTLQIFAAYLVAAWTFLQFVDWALNRYNLSPNWVDLLLWTFIGIIPSLILYLYHRDRINKGIIKLKEKIFIPVNLILLVSILFFAFGNADLGATTKNVTFENAFGNLETKTFTKEEFRTGFNIYPFHQEQEDDSTSSWLTYGIGKVLYQDLIQNKNLSPEYDHIFSTSEKIRDASLFYEKYVDGSFKIEDGIYTLKTAIRKAANAKVLSEKVFEGQNLFNLLDQMSQFIASEIDSKNNITYIDLPISEHITNSIDALHAFVNGDYHKAYTIDNRFSLAYLEDAKQIMSQNKGKLEAQDVIDKAFATKSKLPLQKQLEVFIQRNLAYGNYEEAEKQVKLQLEVDPNNRFYNTVLFSLFGESKNTKAYFEVSEKLFLSNKSSYNGNNLSTAALVVGYENQLLDALKVLEVIDPFLKYLKIQPLIFNGQTEEAKRIFDEFKLTYSERNRLKPYDSIFNFLQTHSINDIDLKPFVGNYRSNNNEQTLELWLEDDRLIEYVKNQPMKAYLPANKDAVAGGNIQNYTYYSYLLKDENNLTYGLIKRTYFWQVTQEFLFWKMDENLQEAQSAFDNKDFERAKQLYTLAKENNPNHVFIDNILGHLNYIKQNDSIKLLNLFKTYEGCYGPRKFWIEDNKFYYKRKDANVNLPKVELLPINDTLFMDMTRLGSLMSFQTYSETTLSKSYSFDSRDFKWKVGDEELNVHERNAPDECMPLME
jgi:hypothetical protein